MERELDFNLLSERISAQTQAAVEFSNALAKIIEQTASIRDKITDSADSLKEEIQNIANDVHNLTRDFDKNAIQNAATHKQFNEELDSFQNQINLLDSKVKKIIDSSVVNHEKLNVLMSELFLCSNKAFEQLSLQIDANTEITKKQRQFIVDMQKEVEKYNIHFIEVDKNNIKNKMFIAAIVSIIGIIGMMAQFGILHFNWFPSK
jgi:methyl-accepting chemotaxis protein